MKVSHWCALTGAAAVGLVAGSTSAWGDSVRETMEAAKIVASDGEAFDNFGHGVAISGDWVVIGASTDDDNGTDSGSAYVYDVTDPMNPVAGPKLLPSDGADGDLFGAHRAIAIDGGLIVVGAGLHDHMGSDSGAVWVFDAVTGAELRKLAPSDPADDARFGRSLAISGDLLVVGAFLADMNGNESGAAYLFDATTGVELAKFGAGDGDAYDWFGYDVAIDGDIVMVSARHDEELGTRSGSAYLFDVSDPGSPVQLAEILAPDGASADCFGETVDIHGDRVIIGAVFDDDNGTDSGSAYLFDISDPTTPALVQKLMPNDAATDDSFGQSVALNGSIVAVGAPSHAAGGVGKAYLFDADTGAQLDKLIPSDGASIDMFGHALAIDDGSTLLSTAMKHDANGVDSGAAYVFELTDGACCINGGCLVLSSVECASVQGTFMGSGVECADGACLPWCPEDLNGDGEINAVDLFQLLGAWGVCE